MTVGWPTGQVPAWVGREAELGILRAGIEAVGRGEGSVIWVEGEPGIGKSALLTEAVTGTLAAADRAGWELGWGTADTLTERR